MVYLPVIVFCLLCILCSLLFCDIVLLCLTACDVRAATVTEAFPCFFLSCKANARV
jgi:hypothetical protein